MKKKRNSGILTQGENVISNKVKALLIASVVALTGCTTAQTRSITANATANSVKVTNPEGNHGGTGIVLRSSDNNSLVLTNSHVCGVVEDGGIVSGMAGNFMVTGYKKSLTHDLCLIKVSGNLQGQVKLAANPPVPYEDKALISGHPSLFPNVKTYGHFSGRDQIQVVIGSRKCTDEDNADPNKGMLCMLLGGIPIIKKYDSILVTATIMAGSSGSAVYNSNMELAGVVFAGSQGLSYAWTVPYEYVNNFLTKEQQTLEFEKVSNNVDLFKGSDSAKKENIMQKLDEVCSSPDRIKIKTVCDIAASSMLK